MKIFDSHSHLDDPSFDKDIDAVITRAQDAEVYAVMIVGVDKSSSIKAVSMAKSKAGCFASVGVHPHNAKDCNEETLSFLSDLAKNPEVRAWGEIGLDFNRMYSPRKDQECWFVRQLERADELNLPVIFHERDSSGRMLEILNGYHRKERKGVIHCFSGDTSELERYIALGYSIGITGILTLKERGADLRELVSLIPVEHLLIETDAPFLTPAPEKKRTRRNEPAFVRSVLLKLAEVRKENPETLSGAIWQNTLRLFNITEDDMS